MNHGGGSGGSILINVTTLEGEGVINASGGDGNGNGGGGSGGRIAVYFYNSDRAPRSSVVTDFFHPVSDSARTWLPLVGDKRTEKYAFDEGMYAFEGHRFFNFHCYYRYRYCRRRYHYLLSLSLSLSSLLL